MCAAASAAAMVVLHGWLRESRGAQPLWAYGSGPEDRRQRLLAARPRRHLGEPGKQPLRRQDGEGGRLRLDFEISDGGQLDADGRVNGSITASGAAAQMPLSIVGQAPDGTHDGFWF
nr:hypothetical protein [Verminephrobacter aporrectodeae]